MRIRILLDNDKHSFSVNKETLHEVIKKITTLIVKQLFEKDPQLKDHITDMAKDKQSEVISAD